MLQAPGGITAKRDLGSGQIVLGRVIDICPQPGKVFCRLIMIDSGLNTI